ncbi:hypothetical protein E1A91_A05G421600v1 [Gossypium mustelinum]|uniref:Uncharacterized protein n=1 Tax=Gossypium mustelinum TaxID=34275 RepID=A0A5D2ZH05_GOSMU|nr:hypothetical protein E1A91_A05G421600v1 [Gossypium mustelinum]
MNRHRISAEVQGQLWRTARCCAGVTWPCWRVAATRETLGFCLAVLVLGRLGHLYFGLGF